MVDIVTTELTADQIRARLGLDGAGKEDDVRRLLGQAPPEAEEEAHPWDPIDLSQLPDTPPPEPTIMLRTDGRGLIYPNTRNLLFAPQESSKTFISLLACHQILQGGGSCLYIDFESSPRAIAHRLRLMGADLRRFGYIRPTLPVDEEKLNRALDTLKPDLVVVDACAEAMVTHLFDENSNADFMRFSRLLLEPIEQRGHSVLLLDHMGNDHTQKRPRGASSKMATISGSALRVEVEVPFRRGASDGRAMLYVEKDREGGVRQYGTSDCLVAIIQMKTWQGRLHVELHPPTMPVEVKRPPMTADRPYDVTSVNPLVEKPLFVVPDPNEPF